MIVTNPRNAQASQSWTSQGGKDSKHLIRILIGPSLNTRKTLRMKTWIITKGRSPTLQETFSIYSFWKRRASCQIQKDWSQFTRQRKINSTMKATRMNHPQSKPTTRATNLNRKMIKMMTSIFPRTTSRTLPLIILTISTTLSKRSSSRNKSVKACQRSTNRLALKQLIRIDRV